MHWISACGCSGRFVDRLITHGYQVEGVDVSERMIALAKERHPNVALHHADICQWNLPRRYDFILAWDRHLAVPLEEQTAVMEKICGGLTQHGVCLFTMGALDEPGREGRFLHGTSNVLQHSRNPQDS
jgi:predicted TPR repeat methyltransferase